MGYPGIIQGKEGDQFGDHVDALFPVGTKMSLPDGRLYRYAEMGGTVGVANKLYQAEVANAGWLVELIVVAHVPYHTSNVDIANTSAAISANDFAEGYQVLQSAAELGNYYVIKEHPAVASGTPGTGIGAMHPGVKHVEAAAVAGGNTQNLYKNLYKDIIIKPASDPTAPIVGIPPHIIAASDWGWVQTRGMASCIYDATQVAATIGYPAFPDSATVGAFMGSDYDTATADNGVIGWVVYVTTDEDFGLIYLTIE